MKIGSYFAHLRFYVAKHGLLGIVRTALHKVWIGTLSRWEWMYAADLQSAASPRPIDGDRIEIQSYRRPEDLDADSRRRLLMYKSSASLEDFLTRFFSRGAVFWLARQDGEVVALMWTLAGGFDGFYSMPINPNEVIVLAVEVFPEYRGRGLFPIVANRLLIELRSAGYSRACLKVHSANTNMQRSMGKTGWMVMGKAYCIPFGSRFVTIWSQTSPQKRKTTASMKHSRTGRALL